ncbi:nucleotide pyrophosphohydrolase [Candidatus Woesearchaeota archaeon]|nr:nucleotide pyrophosphohydrolase [Candidatus Woesearchaeota archaeon]
MPTTSFARLLQAMKCNIEHCPWGKEQSLETIKKEFLSEAEEVAKAIDAKDYENLKEELGDAFWDLLFLTSIAEKEGLFTMKAVLEAINEKIERRKPWLFGKMEIHSIEEAVQHWQHVKKKEKQGKK